MKRKRHTEKDRETERDRNREGDREGKRDSQKERKLNNLQTLTKTFPFITSGEGRAVVFSSTGLV